MIFSRKSFVLELLPLEAAAQRSPTKIWTDLFWPDFPRQDFPDEIFSRQDVSRQIVSRQYFSGQIFPGNVFPAVFVWARCGELYSGGVGPEKLLQ